MSRLSGNWQGRVLALLLLLAVGAALAGVTLVPLWSMNERYQEEINDLQDDLVSLRRGAAMGVHLGPQLERLERAPESDAHYLRSTTEALAAAEMQRLVKAVILAAGGQILSTQPVPAQQDRFFTRVALRVKIISSLDKLVGIFYQIETGSPYLFVDSVSMRGRSRVRRVNATGDAAWPLIDVDLELAAYMRGQPG